MPSTRTHRAARRPRPRSRAACGARPASRSGSTGRSLTTESSTRPWLRRARTTTPLLLSSRSGVSKKNTWRIWASRGSISRAATVERKPERVSGTVSFNSTVSAPLVSASSLEVSSAESGRGARLARVAVCVVIATSFVSRPSVPENVLPSAWVGWRHPQPGESGRATDGAATGQRRLPGHRALPSSQRAVPSPIASSARERDADGRCFHEVVDPAVAPAARRRDPALARAPGR